MKLVAIFCSLLIFLSYGSGFSQKPTVQKLETTNTSINSDYSEYIDAIKIYEKVIEDGQLEDEELFSGWSDIDGFHN